ENGLHRRSVLDEFLLPEDLEVCQGAGRRDRIGRVRAGHFARAIHGHELFRADDRREGRAAGNALAAGGQVGHDAEVLKAEGPARAPEAGLDLVKNEHGLAPVAPRAEGLGV
ncbi:hypothetical protein RZS08_02120, partial [Arthrospira platensis SPKY1]|nr:hypothetical protein [Arthrospira platensis SPKY1]